MTAEKALYLLAKAQMGPFAEDDWYAFAGVESAEPLIGERDGFTVILDGTRLAIIGQDAETGEIQEYGFTVDGGAVTFKAGGVSA